MRRSVPALARAGALGALLFLLAACSADDPAAPDATDRPPDAARPTEICDNGFDDDADGYIDCHDSDCAGEPHCQAEMVCNDGIDNDGDGLYDCDDPDCADNPFCLPESLCSDGVDNDGDGLVDCADPDCAAVCFTGCTDDQATVVRVATGLPRPVDDSTPVTVDLPVAAAGVVTGAAVRFTITHTYAADLDISLRTPAGRVLDLSSDNGGDGDDYIATVLTDLAATPITQGSPPFSGSFRPEEAFATIFGTAADGTWQVLVVDDAADDAGTVDAVELFLCVCDGIDGCELNLACQDGIDNDGDGLVDCADPDCADLLLCVPEVCDDEVDNNGDGLVDCADPQCSQELACVPEVCDDEMDNNGDGLVDCADPQCAGQLVCAASCPAGTSKAVVTAGGLPLAIPDNDVNNPAVASLEIAAPGLVAVVAVQVDIRHPFAADLDIYLAAPGGTIELSTDNGGSGDDYTGTVFVDTAPGVIGTAGYNTAPFTGLYRPEQPLAGLYGTAHQGTWSLRVADDAANDTGTLLGFALLTCACEAASGDCEFGPLACRNGEDDDGDGLVDCEEASCATDPYCLPEPICDDGLDNDFDGLIDCLDPDCDGRDRCELATELTCDDAFDNDGDGLVDCLDPDCTDTPYCLPEADCGDGLDDDGDGYPDCLDPGCDGRDRCELGTELTCDDGFDNDADGLVDCLDPDCDGRDRCELATELTCDDGFDNDGDGLVDCADPDCAPRNACPPIPECPDGSQPVTYAATGLPLAIPDNQPNNPAIATIQVASSGTVSLVAVQIDIQHSFTADLDIYLVAPGGTIELSTDNGGAGDHYIGTTFDDNAATSVTAGSAPFTGRYRPEQPLADLAGTPLAGAWRLQVADDAAFDVGSLIGYRLLLCE
jgi:subtilisin-like proprotein convertase family protein